jgi:hypothetical protein
MQSLRIAALLLLAAFSMPNVFAQGPDVKNTPPTPQVTAPPPATSKIPIPHSPAKDADWAAVHHKDAADKALADLQTQAQQLFQKLQTAQQEADKQVDAADAALLQELKLDPAKYSVNHDTMEATVKTQAPAAVAAGKP